MTIFLDILIKIRKMLTLIPNLWILDKNPHHGEHVLHHLDNSERLSDHVHGRSLGPLDPDRSLGVDPLLAGSAG